MSFPDKLLAKRINQIDPDIVHIHYLGPGVISIKGISMIKQKIVWTLHDSFIFTGGCHTPGNCVRFKDSCGSCEYLKSTKGNDISKKNWLIKEKYLSNNSNIFFTAPSNWMKNCAESSSLFMGETAECIPNLIDNEVYTPKSTEISKKMFNIEPNVKLITIGGSNFDLDPNKGMDYFLSSLQFLNYSSDDIEIFIFGSSKRETIKFNNYKIRYLGYISDQEEIVNLLSASDVVVIPSRQESFGQIAIEAMACGTAVVAFDTSGLKDIIEHKVDGYLAAPFDVEDLAKGIRYLLLNDLSKKVSETVSRKFSEKEVIKKIVLFYNKILLNA
jgi:glycosyltransferase involved in cell wall biosynthesis